VEEYNKIMKSTSKKLFVVLLKLFIFSCLSVQFFLYLFSEQNKKPTTNEQQKKRLVLMRKAVRVITLCICSYISWKIMRRVTTRETLLQWG